MHGALRYGPAGTFVVLGLLSLLSVHCGAPEAPSDRPLHHTNDGFRNVHDHDSRGFLDFLKWRWERLWRDIPEGGDYRFPLAENDPDFLKSNGDRTTLTWIGHATVLLQIGGKNILTDPHFSRRASPFEWAGPERVVPPGVSMEDLPHIDYVILSHDHYDSLDTPTVEALLERPGGSETVFMVPLGLKEWFRDCGATKVVELDWWGEHREAGLTFVAVPVQHWSKRTPFSRNKTLWAGWVVLTEDFRFFFAGDSGYTPHFKEIGERLGPFDLSAIPIGAYEPRWFMRRHHLAPEESVQVHLDVGSRRSVGIHWGTFILTDEPLDEPPRRLAKALKDRNLSGDVFVVPKHGETLILN
jgi:L-ascorbate metabolism protein UlaG (beta-lactamase superfamily)